jgi:NitT/TauT family transport system substrate-binding protein
MFGKDAAATAALTAMAKASGTDIAGFRSQLATTRMFATPAEAHTFMQSPDVSRTMDLVRKFSFEHGILGEGAKTVDAVGISFPSGQVLGDSKNVKMRFDATYTKLAVDGKL